MIVDQPHRHTDIENHLEAELEGWRSCEAYLSKEFAKPVYFLFQWRVFLFFGGLYDLILYLADLSLHSNCCYHTHAMPRRNCRPWTHFLN